MGLSRARTRLRYSTNNPQPSSRNTVGLGWSFKTDPGWDKARTVQPQADESLDVCLSLNGDMTFAEEVFLSHFPKI